MPKYMLFDGILYTKSEFKAIQSLVQKGRVDEARPLMKEVLSRYKARMHEAPPKPRRHHKAKPG